MGKSQWTKRLHQELMRFRTVMLWAWLGTAAGVVPALGVPNITDFSPTAGSPGDQVQLNGSGFSGGGFTVRFWNGGSGVVAPILFINSDTVITVSVPTGITTGPISIQQGAGTQSYTPNDFLAIGPGPFITDFSPEYASVNDTVTISGVHFANTTGVQFHGTAATMFTPNAAGTQISTRVPPGATSGVLTVSTPLGTSNSPVAFTVVGSGPYITAFSPISGDAGTKVELDGLHFTGVTNVTFNGKPAMILSANSDTLIQVQAPVGLTTGRIAINTVLGRFVTSSNFFGKPTITSVTPNNGRAGTNVTVSGVNLLGASAVSFNGLSSADFAVVNNTNLTAVVPAGATTGLIRVVVPGASAFSPTNFVVRPTLSGFSPGFGAPGTSVTITGANLNAGSASVSFNGVPAAAPSGVTFGQLTAKVPAGASTGRISVSTVGGSDTSTNVFYLPAQVTGFTPTNSGPGSRIVITGQNFLGTTAVSFNGTPATEVAVTNNDSIGATVPVGVVSGPISVTTPAGSASSAGLFYGAPVISGFTPTHGLPGASVTIDGVNFLGGRVQFGALAAALISLNNTQIVAIVPAGAQNGVIRVAGPAGTNDSTGIFTLDYTSDLQVGVTNSANPVTIGSNLVYTISIFNAGPDAAPNTVLTNLLPASVLLRSATISPPWLLATNGNVLVATIASLGSGEAYALSLVVSPQSSGNITDSVSITSDNPETSPQDNFSSITTLVEPLSLLSIGRSGQQVLISWPVSLSNYFLQFEQVLGGNSGWVTSTNPSVTQGGFIRVSETNSESTRFFRLHR